MESNLYEVGEKVKYKDKVWTVESTWWFNGQQGVVISCTGTRTISLGSSQVSKLEVDRVDMQTKQVNVGDVVKAEFNGTEADGVVTWVSSCSNGVIFQQQDTGYLFWTDVDNLIEVNTKENFMQFSQEQVFNLGDKVVAPTTVGYGVGTVVSVDFYEDEDQFYYEVYFKDLDTSGDYEAEELYDLEGLQTKFFVYGEEVVKVVDYLENGYVLTVNDGGAVLVVDEDDLEEDNREYCSGCTGCDCSEGADAQNDSIIEELRDLLQQRSATGICKYGTTLDRTDLDSSEWCQHLLEELLDAAGYVLRLKKDLEALQGGYSYVKNNNLIELK